MRILGWCVWGLVFVFNLVTTWNFKREFSVLPERIRHERSYLTFQGIIAWLWILLMITGPNWFDRIHVLWAAPVIAVISGVLQFIPD